MEMVGKKKKRDCCLDYGVNDFCTTRGFQVFPRLWDLVIYVHLLSIGVTTLRCPLSLRRADTGTSKFDKSH